MTNAYNYAPFGNYDYSSILNNPYYLYAANSPNVNFKGSPASQSQEVTATQDTATTTNNGAIPVTTKKDESSGGMNLLTGALGLTLLAGGAYLLIKKPGKIGNVINSLRNGSKDSITESTAEKLKRLTAVKVGKNDIRFMIPDKTVTLKGEAAAKTFAKDNCIPEAISLERQAFNPEKSAITSFICKSSSNEYTIKLENGAITSIKDKTGKEIYEDLYKAATGTPEAKKLEAFENIYKELVKTKDVDTSVLTNISGINYTNSFGDDVLGMSLAKYGDTPVLEEFTTLQRFKFTDKEMQALKLEAGEEAFASSKFFKDGKLIDGLKVGNFSYDIGGGNICKFEGETLISITKPDGTVLPSGSAGYKNLTEKYQKDIDKLIRKVFVKRDFIPDGATIVTG